jgi:hypothetical protein
MRVVDQNAPDSLRNLGVVVFHAGANVARRWEDFQRYSQADQEFFDQLLPVEGLDFGVGDEIEIEPVPRDVREGMEVRGQTGVHVQEIPLLDDQAAIEALRVLQGRGYTPDQVRDAMEELQPVPVTRQRQRQAARGGLDARIATATGRVLAERRVNPEGQTLDRARRGLSNYVVLKSAIDRQADELVGRGPRRRHEFSRDELDRIEADFDGVVARAVAEVFGG